MEVRRYGRLKIVKKNGKFVPKYFKGLDESLVGSKAFEHEAVKEWWRWLEEEFVPREVALILPCSNVKPYTRSPTSVKVRGLLKRLGLIRKISWLYFSDLLILVPYERAEEYPACCYEVHPDVVISNGLSDLVASKLASAMEALVKKGLRKVIVFLPRKHLLLWDIAKKMAKFWPAEIRVKYTIFSLKELEKALKKLEKDGS